MKTPINQLVFDMQMMKVASEELEYSQEVIETIEICINRIKSFIDKEKIIIINSYIQGHKNTYYREDDFIDGYCLKLGEEEFFKQTFE